MLINCKQCGSVIPGIRVTCDSCGHNMKADIKGLDFVEQFSDKQIRTLAVIDACIQNRVSLAEFNKDEKKHAIITGILNLIIPGSGYAYCSKYNNAIFFYSLLHGILAFMGAIMISGLHFPILNAIFAISIGIHGYFYSHTHYEGLGK